MKIALVHYASIPVIGGVEQVMRAHARLFAEHGHDVMIVSQRGEADIRLPLGATSEEYAAVLRGAFRGCDVVFVHNVMSMPFDLPLTSALAAIAKEMSGTRFVAWVHDIAACNPDLAPVPELLQRAQAGFSYVAVSEFRARQFRELTGEQCAIIPNGIEPSEVLGLPAAVAEFAAQRSLLDGRMLLLHPTRLLRRKNVELGLALMRAWKDRGHASALLITGAEDPHNPVSAAYARWLRDECARLDIESEVIFLAHHFVIGAEELAALYRLADALFLPSRQEGFGLPVLEATLQRLPAFTSDIEPLAELAFGSAVHRFAPDISPSQLALRIECALAEDARTVARRRVLVEFAWSRIYGCHLAPLLAGTG